MKSQVRAFIAIEISAQVRSEIDRYLKRHATGLDSVKWVIQDSFHLTLKFLGDVPMNEIHHVIEAVDRSCRGTEPFDLVFEGLGAFPHLENPRTLWVGVTEGIEPSRLLAERIDAELARLGYPPEIRRFTPHLTIGRLKGGRGDFDRRRGGVRRFAERTVESIDPRQTERLVRFLSENPDPFFGVSSVDGVTLFSSELSRSGPKYEVLAELDFRPELT